MHARWDGAIEIEWPRFGSRVESWFWQAAAKFSSLPFFLWRYETTPLAGDAI
jgi:hypothetical protein